eukprot:2035457-Amphidinium_carterae.1
MLAELSARLLLSAQVSSTVLLYLQKQSRRRNVYTNQTASDGVSWANALLLWGRSRLGDCHGLGHL